MIHWRDRAYKSTKRIKQGKKKLIAPFVELADWISSTKKVTVLNIIYHRRLKYCEPRLEIIFEYPSETAKFHRGTNYDRRKQNSIKKKFLNIIESNDKYNFDVENLFVIFSSFAPIAIEEADAQISATDIIALEKEIGNPDLWIIQHYLGQVIFFFYTDGQIKKYKSYGMKEKYTGMYYKILKPHDEFGYLKRKTFKVFFDSKQNFDDNYESSWFYYMH